MEKRDKLSPHNYPSSAFFYFRSIRRMGEDERCDHPPSTAREKFACLPGESTKNWQKQCFYTSFLRALVTSDDIEKRS